MKNQQPREMTDEECMEFFGMTLDELRKTVEEMNEEALEQLMPYGETVH